MAEKLYVELRENFGKGAARRIRAENRIPGVFYGHGTDTRHLTLPGHETALAVRHSNALFELTLPDGRSRLALVKDVQRNPLSRNIIHMDLLEVRRGEKVEVVVPLELTGDPVSPAIGMLDILEVTIQAEATHLPESIVIDTEGAEDGYRVLASDLDLPAGVELLNDPEELVLSVDIPRVEEEDEEDEEAAEPTVIGEEPSEQE